MTDRTSAHRAGRWLLMLWMALVIANFLRVFPPWPHLRQAGSWLPPGLPSPSVMFSWLPGLAAGAGTALGALGAGWWPLRRLRGFTALGRVVLSTSLGMGMLAYLIYGLGALQLYTAPGLLAVWSAGLLACALALPFGLGRDLREGGRQLREAAAQSSSLLMALLAFLLALGLLMVLVPEIFYDSLVYHLGAPRWFLVSGGIRTSHNLHYNYPLTFQMLSLLGLSLQGEIAAKFVHWLCGVLFAGALLAWARERGMAGAGLWGALFFLSIPMVQLGLWTTGVDVGASLFALCAAWSWDRHVGTREGDESGPGGLILAGAFAGLCFGTKLTAAPVALILLLVHVTWLFCQRASTRKVALDATLLFLVILAAVIPWSTRTYLSFGNPFFPFLGDLFGGLDPARAGLFYGESRGVTPGHWAEWFLLPWSVTYSSILRISFLGPGLLAFLPLALWIPLADRRTPLPMRLLLLGALAGCAGMSSVNRLTRYWLPYIAIMMLPMCWALNRHLRASASAARPIVLVTAAVASIHIVYTLGSGFSLYRPWPVLLGRATPLEYHSVTHPSLNPHPSTRMYSWAEGNLPPGSKLLILGDEKVATCRLPFEVSGVYDEPLPVLWSSGLDAAGELRDRFRKEGITHILVNPLEGKRTLPRGTMEWPEKVLALFCVFWDRHVRLLHVEEVPEKYVPGKIPLLLYRIHYEGLPAGIPPAGNPLLSLYVEHRVPAGREDALEEKIELLRGLSARFPDVGAFRRRLTRLNPGGSP